MQFSCSGSGDDYPVSRIIMETVRKRICLLDYLEIYWDGSPGIKTYKMIEPCLPMAVKHNSPAFRETCYFRTGNR